MFSLLNKVRFLPLTIFFAALLLSVKIGNIWNEFGGWQYSPFQIARLQAQTKDASSEQSLKKEPTEQASPDESEDKVEEKPKSTPDVINEDDISRFITDDPTFLSPVEIELLQQLAMRRDNLDAREGELRAREGLLNAAEERIEKKIIDLQNLRLTIDDLIKKFDIQQDKKLKSLVKIYENMKPKSAAAIFEKLEMDTLLEVAEHMKERKLAAIMAQMGQERAREITVELRRLRELPKFGDRIGG